MKRIIDYLAEEEAQQQAKREATKLRKDGKHERVAVLMKNLVKVQPVIDLDFLGD